MNPTHSGIAEMDSAHYPERLGAIAIINAPMALDIAWRVVQVCQWVPSKLHLLSLNSLLKSISLLIFYARSSLYKKKEAISQKENNYWELIISAVVVGIAKDPFDPPPLCLLFRNLPQCRPYSKVWLDARTKAKVHIIRRGGEEALRRLIDISQIPADYGGEGAPLGSPLAY